MALFTEVNFRGDATLLTQQKVVKSKCIRKNYKKMYFENLSLFIMYFTKVSNFLYIPLNMST